MERPIEERPTSIRKCRLRRSNAFRRNGGQIGKNRCSLEKSLVHETVIDVGNANVDGEWDGRIRENSRCSSLADIETTTITADGATAATTAKSLQPDTAEHCLTENIAFIRHFTSTPVKADHDGGGKQSKTDVFRLLHSVSSFLVCFLE